ncbi:MAG: hypothetical protein HC889_16120 [Synechococcaceae cyanobacterium SM1_2_3]|nr:hypothetical protein [Synechococcaceae cyanobacterium SM1_2_3]
MKSMTVLEKSEDVIKLVAPTYEGVNGLRIIHADAFEWKPDREFDWAWHDIWPDMSSDRKKEMTALRRRFQKVMRGRDRQRCWGEANLMRY